MLEAIGLSKLAGLLIGALFSAINDYFARRRNEQSLRDLGAASAAAAANKEAADAQARMAGANAQPHTRDTAIDRLQSGTG